MLKQLSKSIKNYKKETILAPIFVTLEVILDVLIPFLMAYLIDNGINKSDLKTIYLISGILVLCAILAVIFGALSGRYASIASSGFAKNLRQDMYYKVEEYSFANIDKFSTASIITRLTTDVTNVKEAFNMVIRVAIRAPFMLLFALIMSFIINPKIALIYLCVIPFLGLGLIFIALKAHPLFEYVFKTYDKLNNVVEENIRGIRVVKSYVQEEHEINKFTGVSKDIYNNFSKAEKILAFNSPLMQTSVYLCTILIAWIGAHLILSGSMSTGSLTSLITYTMQILNSLMMLSMVFVTIIIAIPSAERIVEIINEDIDLTNSPNSLKEIKDGSIKFDNVSFSYIKDKKKLSLKNINLDIKSGETIGIIGGIGSSKSTLVQLIPRLYDTTEGTIYVGGVDVKKYDIKSLRDSVAMVLQKNVLFSGTIKENLKWGKKDATDKEIEEVCTLAQATEFIEKFPDKYDTYIDQGGTNVSGGQKQRLCIARALLKNPKILILDDSTSAVDTKTDALIRKSFKEKIPNTTKIIIAQRISSVEDADKIIVMDKGTINAIGTHKELLKTNKIYQEVYTSQVKVGDNDD
jgi:ATP-binding cassette subfamily B protein